MSRKFFAIILFLAAVVSVAYLYWTSLSEQRAYEQFDSNPDVIQRTLQNYGLQVSSASDSTGIPSSYLLALIVLESGGKKMIPHRFEPHVMKKLKEVKNGKRKRYERVEPQDLNDAGDEALKNLASSWGPFQIMGYKCFDLPGKKVADLRGEKAILNGATWIAQDYGHLLKEKRYKDAFHYHNTGKLYPIVGPPRTYHPHYVAHGLKYMEDFERRMRKNPELRAASEE